MWYSRARADLDNWRVALEWALEEKHEVELGQRLAASDAVTVHMFDQGEGLRWIRTALRLVDESTPRSLVAKLEYRLACRTAAIGQRAESLAAAQRALRLYQAIGEAREISMVQHMLASSLALLGRPEEAERLLMDALKSARTTGERRLEADVLQKLGWARSSAGDFASARSYLYESLRVARALRAESFAACVRLSIAEMEFEAGAPETALQISLEFLATGSAGVFPHAVATCIANAAAYLVRLGRYDEAKVRETEALELARQLGLPTTVAVALERLAVIALLRSPPEKGPAFFFHRSVVRLFGFAHSRQAALGMATDNSRREYYRALDVLRDALGSDEVTDLMMGGATLTEDEAIAEALALE